MSTGEEVLYRAACEKKKRPLASEFEMNMAAWATRLIPLGMQQGYIQHAEGVVVQMWNRGTSVWMVAARRPESILKGIPSSWKDEKRKGRHKDADNCPNQLWVGH